MRKKQKPIVWLPIDSRLFNSFFSFGHVKGTARIFLEIEIILAVFVVGGTFALVGMQFFLH